MVFNGMVAAVWIFLALLLPGCNSSTDPGIDPTPTIGFFPQDRDLDLRLNRVLAFRTTATATADSLTASWYLDGQMVGQGREYNFTPAAAGRHDLRDEAFSGAVRDTCHWVISVETVYIDFYPRDPEQILMLNKARKFSAYVMPADSIAVSWRLDGQIVGEDPEFTYVPTAPGPYFLEAVAFSGTVRDTNSWTIDVLEDPALTPQEVSGVATHIGPNVADVILSWDGATGNIAYPLVEYIVAVGFDEPVTEDNWDRADILGRYPANPGQGQYSEIYTEADHGMRPGERCWFAVRVVNDQGRLSPLTLSVPFDVTRAWYLGGRVLDDAGVPVPEVTLETSGPVRSTVSGGDGNFLFDQPFHNIDLVRIEALSSSLYPFETDPITGDDDTTRIDLTLINRYPLGNPACWNGEFLHFLQDVTRNQPVAGDPDASRLYKWEEYPVTVFIPSAVNRAGVDMEAASLAGMEFWNETMRSEAASRGRTETDYFVRTTDAAAANIVFLFEYSTVNYGRVSLLIPSGPDNELGDAVPEKMQVWINTTAALDLFTEVQGVALHELGHTLGIYQHADCLGVDYLMKTAGGAGAMNRSEPIHRDEIRAVRAIRNLPQGMNLGLRPPYRMEMGTALFR